MQNKIIDVSWDFRGEKTKSYTHGFHSYPAMMIPQVAERLIKENIGDGKVILDPFCGSGTVLVESMKINKKSYGVDMNPLAVLIAKVKTTPINPDMLLKSSKKLIMNINLGSNTPKDIPNFQNINFWFKKNVIRDLTLIKQNIDNYKYDQNLYNFFLVAFSETVRQASNTRSGEFKLYRKSEEHLKDYKPEAIKLFEKRLLKSVEAMGNFYTDYKNSKRPTIIRADTKGKLPIKESIDLVVTSPPYGDSKTTVAYGQFSRLSLQWLDVEDDNIIKNIDNSSLGGKRYKQMEDIGSPTLNKILSSISEVNPQRALDVYSFNYDFYKCLQNLIDYISNDGVLCFVVGNRTVANLQIPTDDILVELGETVGLSHLKTIIRNIPSKRMPIENSPSNVKGKLGKTMTKEHIVIMQKK